MTDRTGPVIPFRPRRPVAVEPEPPPPRRPRGLPPAPGQPTGAQRTWLACGVTQPGGKLPLFDGEGRRIDPRTIRACLDQGWAERWFVNPLKPDWLVCRLTPAGRAIVHDEPEA